MNIENKIRKVWNLIGQISEEAKVLNLELIPSIKGYYLEKVVYNISIKYKGKWKLNVLPVEITYYFRNDIVEINYDGKGKKLTTLKSLKDVMLDIITIFKYENDKIDEMLIKVENKALELLRTYNLKARVVCFDIDSLTYAATLYFNREHQLTLKYYYDNIDRDLILFKVEYGGKDIENVLKILFLNLTSTPLKD